MVGIIVMLLSDSHSDGTHSLQSKWCKASPNLFWSHLYCVWFLFSVIYIIIIIFYLLSPYYVYVWCSIFVLGWPFNILSRVYRWKIAFWANSGTFTVMFINVHCPCKKKKKIIIYLGWPERASTFSANCNFWVNYSFNDSSTGTVQNLMIMYSSMIWKLCKKHLVLQVYILQDLFRPFTTILPLAVPLAFCWVTRETKSPVLFNISCFLVLLGMLSAHIASATNQSPVQCVYNSLLADGRSHRNTQHLWFKRTAHKIHVA